MLATTSKGQPMKTALAPTTALDVLRPQPATTTLMQPLTMDHVISHRALNLDVRMSMLAILILRQKSMMAAVITCLAQVVQTQTPAIMTPRQALKMALANTQK